MAKLLITVREAAEMAGISRTLAYIYTRNGTWPVCYVGEKRRGIRVPIAGLQRWIDANVEGGVPEFVAGHR